MRARFRLGGELSEGGMPKLGGQSHCPGRVGSTVADKGEMSHIRCRWNISCEGMEKSTSVYVPAAREDQ